MNGLPKTASDRSALLGSTAIGSAGASSATDGRGLSQAQAKEGRPGGALDMTPGADHPSKPAARKAGRAARPPPPSASNTGRPEPVAYRIDDACAALGLGRTKIYELARQGKLVLLKIAGRSLIDAASVRALIAAARAEAPAKAA